jgi:uncharacterized protein YdiU (UPF0061 family)
MIIGSKHNMMLIGFTLSLVSVVFNSLVITYVNRRLKEVDEERISLSDSLERQAAALTDGGNQFNLYRVMHNLRFAVPPGKAPEVADDASNQLQSALTKYYQGAYDIPQTEITNAETEELGLKLPMMEKDLQLERDWEVATSPAEKERLKKAGEELRKQLPEPKSDVARKLRELDKFAGQAEDATSEAMLFSGLLPVMKSFQDEVAKSTEKKRSRLRELQAARASLVRRSDYASAGAIFFQLLGLMFILARDLWNQRVAAQQKAS